MSTPHPQRVAYTMRALGRRGLPLTISVAGKSYHLAHEAKHDFWAATGFYDSDMGERVVLKASRAEDFAGFSLRWIGRRLRAREMRFYRKLEGLTNVPRVLGTVDETGFVLEFVRGRQLSGDQPVPDGFFHALRELIGEIHRRGIAYVDMNKHANILIDEQGRPHLVDFQISYDLHELGDNRLNRWLLRRLQREDLYHITKHHARLRPDELSSEQLAAAEQRSILIRMHRMITKPWFGFRRRTWRRLRETGRLSTESSE